MPATSSKGNINEEPDFDFPFELPANFPAAVEDDLAKESMTSKTMAAFLTAVAHLIFSKKKYPSRADFNTVARSIISKYPFMALSKGSGYDHITGMLKDRLKDSDERGHVHLVAQLQRYPNDQQNHWVLFHP